MRSRWAAASARAPLAGRRGTSTTGSWPDSVAARERLVSAHLETFGVPPALESHRKVQVALDHGNDEAIREVITAAYDLQRKR